MKRSHWLNSEFPSTILYIQNLIQWRTLHWLSSWTQATLWLVTKRFDPFGRSFSKHALSYCKTCTTKYSWTSVCQRQWVKCLMNKDSKKFICWVHRNPLVWIMKARCSIINVCMLALCSCACLACEGNFIILTPLLFIQTWRTCTHSYQSSHPSQLKTKNTNI